MRSLRRAVRTRETEKILITGSAGLVGRALAKRLAGRSEVVRYDLRHNTRDGRYDLHDAASLERAVRSVTGIVHLAAVSRVIEGENDPLRCWSTNVEATRDLLRLALQGGESPWFIFASSREVYGQQSAFPVKEDAPLRPLNAYARSKAAAERLLEEARQNGLRTAVVRLANVYGDTDDYADRVVPAYAAAAARGGLLRIDGPGNALDFTHLDDVTDGFLRVIALLSAGEDDLPPVHFVSGIRTTLAELAAIAVAAGSAATRSIEGPAKSFAAREFYGDPARALSLLDWRAKVPIQLGMANLISAYARANMRVRASVVDPVY